MANSLMGMMGGAPATGMNMGVLQQMKQAMGMFRAMKDPRQARQMIETAMQQNPEVTSTLRMAQGGNPVEIFREECRKHGIDANQAMNALGLTPPKGC